MTRTTLQRLRRRYRDTRLRRELLRQSMAWSGVRACALEASRGGACWSGTSDRRRERIDEVTTLVLESPALRRVVADLGLSRAQVRDAYRTVIRHSKHPWAARPYHLPTALMLLPDWLEAVGALHLTGELGRRVADLESALIVMDGTFPLSVIEPLVFSGRLAYSRSA